MASIISASTTSGTALNLSGDTTGVLQIATGATPTTAVTINASQNVGIGTASPLAGDKLTISGGYGTFLSGSSGTEASLSVGRTTTDLTLGIAAVAANYFSGSAAGDAVVAFGSGNLLFGSGNINTSGTERMRITSGGYLKASNNGSYPLGGVNAHEVASSAADTTFFVTNSNANPYGSLMYFSGAAPNGTGNNFLQCQDTSAQRANIRSNGGLANYSANNTNLSDQREKTNIELAGSYLDKVCAIPVKTFNYIDQNMEEDGGLTLGVIAQDVQAVAPELVMESNWAGKDEPEKLRLSIYQTDLQYALMKCIQEQQTLIVSQSELINSLTARVTALEAK